VSAANPECPLSSIVREVMRAEGMSEKDADAFARELVRESGSEIVILDKLDGYGPKEYVVVRIASLARR
jgi:hypothetical protein